MPPKQCPECGRFLKQALVDGLVEGSAPCPGCGAELDASMFGLSATMDDGATSVRPPDLEPEDVRDDPATALTGWDSGGEVVDLEHWRDGRPPFPVDTAVVGGAAATGALLGGLVARRAGRSPVGGAAAGFAVGAVAAAVARRLWRLEDERPTGH